MSENIKVENASFLILDNGESIISRDLIHKANAISENFCVDYKKIDRNGGISSETTLKTPDNYQYDFVFVENYSASFDVFINKLKQINKKTTILYHLYENLKKKPCFENPHCEYFITPFRPEETTSFLELTTTLIHLIAESGGQVDCSIEFKKDKPISANYLDIKSFFQSTNRPKWVTITGDSENDAFNKAASWTSKVKPVTDRLIILSPFSDYESHKRLGAFMNKAKEMVPEYSSINFYSSPVIKNKLILIYRPCPDQ